MENLGRSILANLGDIDQVNFQLTIINVIPM